MFKAIANWWKDKQQQRRDALNPERKVIVSFNDSEVSVAFPSGETQSIGWQRVQYVAIETSDSGPWGADVWWLLEGTDSRVAYPQGSTGDSEILEQFPDRFPDFNHAAVIQAMGCASNARFVCWQRRAGP